MSDSFADAPGPVHMHDGLSGALPALLTVQRPYTDPPVYRADASAFASAERPLFSLPCLCFPAHHAGLRRCYSTGADP